MKAIQFMILSLFILTLASSATEKNMNDIPGEIITAFKTGNANSLSKFISGNLELTIDATEDIYSKSQAIQILQNFFSKNSPKSFVILHKGGGDSSRYAIGNLSTGNGSFRVTILLKSKNSSPYIHQLRIEKEK